MTRGEAIAAALVYAGLDASFGGAVDEQIDTPREGWAICCQSGCEPCVEQVHRATLRARELLGVGDPG